MSMKKLTLAAALMSLTLSGCIIATTPIESTGTSTTPGASSSAAPQGTNTNMANKAVRDVQVSQASMVILTNRSQKVMATVRYTDGSTDGNVTLSSDDTTIVAINATTGELTGTKPGVATIRATAANDPTKFALIQVTVREGETEDLLASITPKEGKIDVGGTIQLSARLQDSNSNENANGNWSSSNKTVANVNPNGLVTGLKDGVVTITFQSSTKNTVSATAQITVGNVAAEPAPSPSPTPTPEPTTISTTTVTTETAVIPNNN